MDQNDIRTLQKAVEESIEETRDQDPVTQEQRKLMGIMQWVVGFIDTHSDAIRAQVEAEEQEQLLRNPVQAIMLSPHQYMAEKLYDAMLEQEGELPPEITVREGGCLHLNAYQWFVIKGDPYKVHDIGYDWLIDPTPPDMLSVMPGTKVIAPVRTAVYAPHSPWQLAFEGQITRGGSDE